MALQIRRGTEAQRAALSGVDVPALGELLYTTDTKKLYIGDGVSGGGQDAGYFSSLAVTGQDTLLSSGDNNVLTVVAGTNITLTTDDNTNSLTINGPANFNGGTIAALAIGEAYAANPTDSVVDIEGSGMRLMRMAANMSVASTNTSPFIQIAAYRTAPANNNAGPMIEFRQSTVAALDEVIADIKSVVTNIANGAETGKLVFGVVNAPNVAYIDATGFVGNVTGDVTGDLKGSVFADDSSMLVDAINGNFFGNLTGNVTGNLTGHVIGSVFADDSTVLVDGPSGVLRGEHIGTLTGDVTGRLFTTQLSISNNLISSTTGNDNVIINPAGTGSVNITSNLIASGIQVSGPSIDGSSGDGAILSANPTPSAVPLRVVEIHNTAVATGGVLFARGRGDIVAYQNQIFETVQNNDSLKKLIFAGHDGTDFRESSSITAVVDGAVSAGNVPGKLAFATVQLGGTSVTRLTVSSTAITVTVPFQVVTYADATARDAAITSPAAGMIVFLTGVSKFSGYNGAAWDNLN
jgi:hypothetical protein